MQKVLPKNTVLIPDNATTAFSGILFDVCQWPQEMFDGSVKTFEMLRRPDTMQIIVVDGSKILLVHDEQPGRPIQVHFPGGRVDAHEASWLDAAQRELQEETGLVCSDWRLIDVQQPIIKIEWFTPIFLATGIERRTSQSLDLGGEKIVARWYEFDEVRERTLAGAEQMMQYLVPLFNRVRSVEELVSLPLYRGVKIDR